MIERPVLDQHIEWANFLSRAEPFVKEMNNVVNRSYPEFNEARRMVKQLNKYVHQVRLALDVECMKENATSVYFGRGDEK